MKTMKKLIIALGVVLTLFLATLTASAEQVYTREGNKIYFGSYPQSKVTDTATISTLNELAGALPTSSNSQTWTDYGYYSEGKVKSFMWYIDIEQGGEKYRGVYFTEYRPELTTNNGSTENTNQEDNGYIANNRYWFKYEPISWTVLSEDNGTALILCDMIIDSQQFDYDGNSSNNYAESTIRIWLNDTFYNTAFTDLQRQMILMSVVDNSILSTGYSSNPYICSNTIDKIFLLSYRELATYFPTNETRVKYTTDYSRSQGVGLSTVDGETGYWWLRSPSTKSSFQARGVDRNTGTVDIWFDLVNDTGDGIVPALVIDTQMLEEISAMQIFTFKGYSIGPDGKSVCAGYEIDYGKIEAYKAETNLNLEFGAVFTLFDALEGKTPLDSSTGEVVLLEGANTVKANISSFEYPTYEFKITDVSEEFKNYNLVIAGYVYNGERVIYCQDYEYSENVSSVSFNQIINKTV